MVDFITKLPVVAGKDVILVVCNRLSKMTHFVATTEGTSVEGLARLFRDNVWRLHGLPESMVSDRGPQFAEFLGTYNSSSKTNPLTEEIVLSMEYTNERWRLVACLSELLNETKQNYEIYNKEMLVVIRELEAWKHLLEGAKFKFEVWTDYKNVEYFMKT